MNLDLHSQRTTSLFITKKNTLNNQTDNFVYRSHLEAAFLPSFPSKSLNYRVINLYLHKLSSLSISNFTISMRTDVTWQKTGKELGAITMRSTFTPGCRCDNSNIKHVGNTYCPNTVCSGILCTKRFFNLLKEVRCESTCQVRINLFEEPTSSFFLKGDQGT